MMSVNERAGPPLSTSYSKVTKLRYTVVINGDPEVINGARGGLVNHMRSLLFQKLLISLINVINQLMSSSQP